MKIIIASDIHGSAYYCNKLVGRFKDEKADRLLLLGDILYHGPRNPLPKEYDPKQVLSMLNNIKEKIVCVRGNCDSEVDQMVLEFPIMSDTAIIDTGEVSILASHGHIYHPGNLPPMAKGSIFASGHIHIPVCEDVGGVLCINPGSTSLPKEDTPSSYLVIENRTLTWKDLDGNEYKKHNI
ncbi:MAG: phosphodiesterase [Eubacteriales bacterium]|nr:phosphodiesterase [Eubacteriales bacterium]